MKTCRTAALLTALYLPIVPLAALHAQDAQSGGNTSQPPGRLINPADFPVAHTAAEDQSQLQIFSLENSDPGQMKSLVENLFDRQFEQLASDQRTSSLIVRASEGQLQEIGQLILEVDQAETNNQVFASQDSEISYFAPAPSGRVASASRVDRTDHKLATYPLRNTGAHSVARTVQNMFGREQILARADSRSNLLIVRASPSTHEEVRDLLKHLDRETSEPKNPDLVNEHAAPIAFDFAIENAEPRTFSFYARFAGKDESTSLSTLRQQATALERETIDLARKSGQTKADRKKVRALVAKSFQARQGLHRAELKEFVLRMKRLEQTITMRDKIAEQIIDRRVDDLLNPELQWNADAAVAGKAESQFSAENVPPEELPNPRQPGSSAATNASPDTRSGAGLGAVELEEHLSKWMQSLGIHVAVERTKPGEETTSRGTFSGKGRHLIRFGRDPQTPPDMVVRANSFSLGPKLPKQGKARSIQFHGRDHVVMDLPHKIRVLADQVDAIIAPGNTSISMSLDLSGDVRISGAAFELECSTARIEGNKAILSRVVKIVATSPDGKQRVEYADEIVWDLETGKPYLPQGVDLAMANNKAAMQPSGSPPTWLLSITRSASRLAFGGQSPSPATVVLRIGEDTDADVREWPDMVEAGPLSIVLEFTNKLKLKDGSHAPGLIFSPKARSLDAKSYIHIDGSFRFRPPQEIVQDESMIVVGDVISADNTTKPVSISLRPPGDDVAVEAAAQ